MQFIHPITKHIEIIETTEDSIVMYAIQTDWLKSRWRIDSPSDMKLYATQLDEMRKIGYKRINPEQ